MLATAIAIAATAFEQDRDRGGAPYIMHLLTVMHKVQHLGEKAMICAILHDLIEDKGPSGYDSDFLQAKGFPEDIVKTIELLTHRKGVPYIAYIYAMSSDPIAVAVKMADLEHNMQVSRLRAVRERDVERLVKYCEAYQYLSNL